jgi:multicomponent Na+:H+ antiporter subunit F
MINTPLIFHYSALFGFVIFAFSASLALIQLFKGPYTSQRVIALDFMASLTIASISCFAAWQNNAIYLGVIIALVLVLLIGTVSYAHYLHSRIYTHREFKDD